METAFVIGNGKTRLDIKLKKLRGKGTTYGCNYLYEDFVPDVLVATDLPIATIIEDSGYAKKHVFYTRNPQKKSGAKKIIKNYGYSSGSVATTLACIDGCRYIYLIGMDLMGLGTINNEKQRTFNNVYSDKQFYKKSNREETYYGNWVNQIHEIMKEYKDRKFIRVNPHLNYTPDEWKNCSNYSNVDLKQFLKNINTM